MEGQPITGIRRLWRGIFLALWLAGLFLVSTAEGNGDSAILKVEVTPTDRGSRVTLTGSRPFEYSAFKMADPPRVVIDLPKTRLGEGVAPLEVGDGIIGAIRLRAAPGDGPGLRVEIGLQRNVEYDLTPAGNLLHVDLGREILPAGNALVRRESPPRSARAGRLTQIEISPREKSLQVEMKGDGALPEHRAFQLSRPSRLVVDLPRLKNASGQKIYPVNHTLLREIRLGQHPGKLRLVFTFPGKDFPPYEIVREGTGLRLNLGRAPQQARRQTRFPSASAEKIEAPRASPPPAAAAGPEVKPSPPPKGGEKPAAVEEAGGQATPAAPQSGSARISLDLKDADIQNVLRLIADVSNLNIVTSEEVKGRITIRLMNVPWEQALDVILVTKNLTKIQEGNVIRITTQENIRKELEEKQKEEANLIKSLENKEQAEGLITVTLRINYAKVGELQKLITGTAAAGAKSLLTPRGSVKADERTNTLILQDTRARIGEITALIKKLDSPTPQVLIEARVVQAATRFARAIGIQWGGSINQTGGGRWAWGLTGNNPNASPGWGFTPNQAGGGSSTNIILPSNFVVNFPASTTNTRLGGVGISFGKLTGDLVNLDLRLQLGETTGETKVIARPKLATLDNTPAFIKQGEKIPYETVSQAGTQVQFIDAVLKLEVTPHVTPDQTIKMVVKVNRDARGSFRSATQQVPSIDNREAQTEVLVRDGETLVIGGIYESQTQGTEEGIPWLMRVPVLGWLFKNRETLSSKNELLIFITPTIIKANPT